MRFTIPHRARTGLALTLALAASLALAAPAGAYRIGGKAWPGHTITYYNAAPSSAQALAAGVHAWNASGAGIRFVATSRASAQVLVQSISKAHIGGGDTLGLATVGYAPASSLTPNPLGGAPVHGAHVWLVPPSQSGGVPSFVLAQIAAHELGHVLGLGHETRGCADMNPVQEVLCPAPHEWQERCRPLEPDDIAGAIALYGGHATGTLGHEFCDIAPKPGAPTALTGTSAPQASLDADLAWTNPPGLTVNGRFSFDSLHGRPTVEQYYVDAVQGACAAPSVTGNLVLRSPTTAGAHISVSVHPPLPGQWCFTVFVSDAFGRLSAPAHVIVNVPTSTGIQTGGGGGGGTIIRPPQS